MRKPLKTVSNQLELQLLSQSFKRIVGIDEVGRGAFAGPVFVGAFIFTSETTSIPGVNDSKKLSGTMRNYIFSDLIRNKHLIKSGPVTTINKIGVGKTVEQLVSEIINELADDTTYFLIDGHFPSIIHENAMQILKGDSLHYSISSASIIAKVTRDNYMHKLHKKYPQYGFIKNVGYGTATHIEALAQYGITREHRLSFRPISAIYQGHI